MTWNLKQKSICWKLWGKSCVSTSMQLTWPTGAALRSVMFSIFSTLHYEMTSHLKRIGQCQSIDVSPFSLLAVKASPCKNFFLWRWGECSFFEEQVEVSVVLDLERRLYRVWRYTTYISSSLLLPKIITVTLVPDFFHELKYCCLIGKCPYIKTTPRKPFSQSSRPSWKYTESGGNDFVVPFELDNTAMSNFRSIPKVPELFTYQRHIHTKPVVYILIWKIDSKSKSLLHSTRSWTQNIIYFLNAMTFSITLCALAAFIAMISSGFEKASAHCSIVHSPIIWTPCWAAFEQCRFRFSTQEPIPVFVMRRRDVAFTPRIISKHPEEMLGVLNSNHLQTEIVYGDVAVPLMEIIASPPFASTQIKPFAIPGMNSSGIGHQGFSKDQRDAVKHRCIRVYFSSYQHVAGDGSVIDNFNFLTKDNNACVVFFAGEVVHKH